MSGMFRGRLPQFASAVSEAVAKGEIETLSAYRVVPPDLFTKQDTDADRHSRPQMNARALAA